MVEWSCTKEKINERGPYISVEWSCANKRSESVGTLNSGRMVEHIALAKITECAGRMSLYSFYGQMLDCSVCNFQSMNEQSHETEYPFLKILLLHHQVCYMHDLIRRKNGQLANEAFMSNTIVFLKQ